MSANGWPSMLGGLDWPVAYVVLLLLYVLMHYMFVSQSAQVLALLGVFLDVGIQAGVPVPLMGFALLFASSYFSTLTPQGGSQNVIFVASGYLTQGELYRLGLMTTVFCTLVFLVIGTPWILWVGRRWRSLPWAKRKRSPATTARACAQPTWHATPTLRDSRLRRHAPSCASG
jgi:di/tricarboxylate transporter